MHREIHEELSLECLCQIIRNFGWVWFIYFFILVEKTENFWILSVLIITILSFRNMFIKFCRRGNLSMRNRLNIFICIMSILLFRNRSNWFSIQREKFKIRIVLRSKSTLNNFRALPFSGWSKTFDN